MKQAALYFKNVANSDIIFEEARKSLCASVDARNKQVFPYGRRGTSVVLLGDAVLTKFRETKISALHVIWPLTRG